MASWPCLKAAVVHRGGLLKRAEMTAYDVNLDLPRDRHLFGPGRKRILALDGGGVRGALTIAFLEKLEKQIEEIEGKPVLLGDWFDLIGGTSTGSIIACALALGYRAADIHEFYNASSPRIFYHSRWRIGGIQTKFDSNNLMGELTSIIRGRTLGSEDLRSGLAIVTKRLDTGSPWILLNNPKSQYWNTPPDGSFVGNCHYPLANLVRASTAAPYYFDPQPISIAAGMAPGLFVDGGFSPHNNPALYLFLVASLPQYNLSWSLGTDELTIISIGTGSYRHKMGLKQSRWSRIMGFAVQALVAQMSDSDELILALMSWLGHSPTKWIVNSEMGDLGAIAPPNNRPLFRFLRYDVRLESNWLAEELGITMDEATVANLRPMDNPENVPALYKLGVHAAGRLVRREDLLPVIKPQSQGSPLS